MEELLKQNLDEVVELCHCGATISEAIQIVRAENKEIIKNSNIGCPSEQGLSNYHGVSHGCQYKGEDKQLCKECVVMARIHYCKGIEVEE